MPHVIPAMQQLTTKIATCTDFTTEERELLIEALNLGDYGAEHTYPRNARPGANIFSDIVWEIMDQLRPDAMVTRDRYQLAGAFTGALLEMYTRGQNDANKYRQKPPRTKPHP